LRERISFLIILSLAGFLGEALLNGLSKGYKYLAGSLLLLIFFFVGRKVLSQYQTASMLFGAVSLAVAYSTFLSHTEIYYSFWFNFLLSALFLSVFSCLLTLKPSLSLHYISFAVFHLSILVVGLGFVFNALGERRCYLPLHRGQELRLCLPIIHGRIIERKEEFPLSVKLLDFKVGYYSQNPVLGIFLHKGDKYRIIKTFELNRGRSYFGARFLGFEEEVKALKEKWGEGDRGAAPLGRIYPPGWVYSKEAFVGMLAVVAGRRTLYYLPEKGQAVVLPDFAFIIKDYRESIPGHTPQVRVPLLVLRVYTGYGTREVYLPEGKKGLSFGPYSLYFSTSQPLPRVIRPERTFSRERKLRLLRGIFEIGGRKIFLVPNGQPYFQGKFAYRLMRPPAQEKEYVSLLLVGDRKFRIRVNSPGRYKGYTFYQSDYNPSDPDFSGVTAVREPGELPFYLGFSLLALGALLNLVYRRRTWK